MDKIVKILIVITLVLGGFVLGIMGSGLVRAKSTLYNKVSENLIEAIVYQARVHYIGRISNEMKEINGGCDYWNGIARKYTQSEQEQKWIEYIMFCESRCNSKAINKLSGASGLVQIIEKYHPEMRGKSKNGELSIDWALRVYRDNNGQVGRTWECHKEF